MKTSAVAVITGMLLIAHTAGISAGSFAYAHTPGRNGIPRVPVSSGNPAIRIDPMLIRALADEYESRTGGDAGVREFYLGYLPLRSSDELCGARGDRRRVRALLGNLFVSGYFGGIWLRDALAGPGQRQDLLRSLAAALPWGLRRALARGTEQMVLGALTSMVRCQVAVAFSPGRAAITAVNGISIGPLLSLYGYNLGYLRYILRNPPAGAEQPDAVIDCEGFLDCTMNGIEENTLTTLERYRWVHEMLAHPGGKNRRRWEHLVNAQACWGTSAAASGALVWDSMMNFDRFPPASYPLLVDLSARFLLVAELCILPAMAGWAERDPDAGACAMLQEAAMSVWAGSYFMGLASAAPRGTFPSFPFFN